jgi:CubicO group peptidase (beta-lactamase class C family)
MKKLRIGLLVLGAVLAAGLAFVLAHPREARRAIFMGTLFQGVDMTDEFADMRSLFPIHPVRTAEPAPLPVAAAPVPLPETYEWQGERRSVGALLEETATSGLLVLADGEIVHEAYALTGGPDTRWISWSVAKSFVSALVGIALEEGRFGSVEEPVTKYVPELSGSAYDGVRIKDVLQMSSGASWNEDYGDYTSDISRFGMSIVFGSSQDAFAASLRREREPGTYNRYNSTDTQVLGMLLTRVTGRALADYMQAKLWQPLHMEHDAYWITDDPGMELAFCGLNATLRDYARFGELYRRGGRWNGEQVVPAAWVAASVRPDAPHLQPGENPQSDWVVGYGYQWWIPESREGEFSAIGVYNQFVYVNPTRGVVIAKTSANPAYGTDESTDRELETLAMFGAIARRVRPGR